MRRAAACPTTRGCSSSRTTSTCGRGWASSSTSDPELRRLLSEPTVRDRDGMLYLGKCGGPVDVTHSFRHESAPPPGLLSSRGYGVCNHGLAFTKWRAARLGRRPGRVGAAAAPPHGSEPGGVVNRSSSARPDHWPMVFGGAVEPRNGTGHHGVVYQDRDRWQQLTDWDTVHIHMTRHDNTHSQAQHSTAQHNTGTRPGPGWASVAVDSCAAELALAGDASVVAGSSSMGSYCLCVT